MRRRHVLGASVASLALSACQQRGASGAAIAGGYAHEALERGHFLRDLDLTRLPVAHRTIRTSGLILGGGVAGLSAARAWQLSGKTDWCLLELGDDAGGNARSAVLQGVPHPLAAHYLPIPSDDAPHVQNFLQEIGLRQRIAGRWEYDERWLCHSPQERLFFQGAWQSGLLPLQGVAARTLAQYQQFSALIERWRATHAFTIPTKPVLSSKLAQLTTVNALHTQTFANYLDTEGFDDPHLRWYLDYCCRDDYGAGLAVVSAWAGVHYFAARHGFYAPNTLAHADATPEQSAVLTWPEGNAFLTKALTQPMHDSIKTGRIILHLETTRSHVQVLVWNVALQLAERYEAPHAIVALPAMVAAKVWANPDAGFLKRAKAIQYAAWSVANIACKAPLRLDSTTAGTAPEMAWDNVIYQTNAATSLGYVNACHQTQGQWPMPSVLTHYSAYGISPKARHALWQRPWIEARDAVLHTLAMVHGDVYEQVSQVNITRYGHAMAVPVPRLAEILPHPVAPRLAFAHSDWVGYSVFEEAFEQGIMAARQFGAMATRL